MEWQNEDEQLCFQTLRKESQSFSDTAEKSLCLSVSVVKLIRS